MLSSEHPPRVERTVAGGWYLKKRHEDSRVDARPLKAPSQALDYGDGGLRLGGGGDDRDRTTVDTVHMPSVSGFSRATAVAHAWGNDLFRSRDSDDKRN